MLKGTVLIIEDEQPILVLFKMAFEMEEVYTIKTATTFQEILDLLGEMETPLVVLVDENFPGGNGAQAAQALREKFPGAKLISTSSDDDRFITWGPDARFQKPFAIKDLLPRVAALMKQQT